MNWKWGREPHDGGAVVEAGCWCEQDEVKYVELCVVREEEGGFSLSLSIDSFIQM